MTNFEKLNYIKERLGITMAVSSLKSVRERDNLTLTAGIDTLYDAITEPDSCQICNGKRGGVAGNENIVEGLVICDYCHADLF